MNILITQKNSEIKTFNENNIDDAINYLIEQKKQLQEKCFSNIVFLDDKMKKLLKDYFWHFDVDTISVTKMYQSDLYKVYVELYTTDKDEITENSQFLEKNILELNQNIDYNCDIEDENEDYEEIKVVINIDNLDLSLENKYNFDDFEWALNNCDLINNQKSYLDITLSLPEEVQYRNDLSRKEIIDILKNNNFKIETFIEKILIQSDYDVYIGLNPYMWRFHNVKGILIEKSQKELDDKINELKEKEF